MKLPRGKPRRAIGWALMVIFGITLVFGISWLIFYYGVIQPASSLESSTFGSSIYDPTTYVVTQTVTAWWPFIILVVELVWGFNQSNKRDLASL
jgi:hypothetical protein